MLRERKRNLIKNLIIAIVSLLVITSVNIPKVKAQSIMKVGDYVRFGNYLGKPILWRVINIDNDGSPMLYSERILCLKAFDAAESGKYEDDEGKSYNGDEYRQKLGSNNWENSNIREWLNSDEAKVNYTTQPPTKDAIYEGYNDFSAEAGFLSNFSTDERSAIKPIIHKFILSESNKDLRTGGNEKHMWNADIGDCVQNFDEAYYKNVTDKVYLLDLKEIHDYVYNRGWEYRRMPTEEAIEASNYKNPKTLSAERYWWNWTRTPYFDNPSFVRTIQRNQEFDHGGDVNANCSGVAGGIVPAINLKAAVVKSGSGTKGDPYIPYDGEVVQNNWQDYKDEKNISSSNKSWTIKFNKSLDPSIINNDNVFVAMDPNGQNKVNNLLIKVGNSEDEILVNYDNKELWESGKTYYLFIKNNIRSSKQENLKDNMRMKFNVKF